METLIITVKDKKERQLVTDILERLRIKVKPATETDEPVYNHEFVKEIQKSRASKGKIIKTSDLWK